MAPKKPKKKPAPKPKKAKKPSGKKPKKPSTKKKGGGFKAGLKKVGKVAAKAAIKAGQATLEGKDIKEAVTEGIESAVTDETEGGQGGQGQQ